MVLSRKKLKEKLRNLLADTESNNGAIDGKEDIVNLVQSVKERLRESQLRRPRPSRPRRKKKPSLSSEDGQEEKKDGETEGKGDETRAAEKASSEKKAVKKEKKKKEKKKKKKDKKNNNKDEKKEGVNQGTRAAVSEMKGERNALVPSISTKPAESEETAKKVYVGGIPYYSTEDDIKSFFESCGTVTNIDCMKFPETGKFRGIAILTFKTESAAKRAISLDGSDMGGFYLKIQPYKGKGANKPDFSPQTVEGYNRIYIGNLSWDVTEDDLKNVFKSCKITSIRFGTDKSTGDFKGYAHVDFEEGDSLAIALKLDQQMVRGRPVRIRCAVPRRASESGNDTVKKASDNNDVIAEEEKGVRTGEESEVHKKQKRRTCYECGTPGHLSSACPNKKTNVDSNNAILQGDVDKMREEEAVYTTQEVHKKQKRRTCYECGTPGHLSSDCPNKKAIVAGDDTILDHEIQQEPNCIIREEEPVVDTQEGSVRKKKKRRTCYECGTPGHLSSECPNKTS